MFIEQLYEALSLFNSEYLVFGNFVLGKCTVKAGIVNNDKSGRIFNASTCGDNCARWLLEIGKDKDVTVNLHHMMDFGGRRFAIRVLNNGEIAHSMSELIDLAGEYVWRPQK